MTANGRPAHLAVVFVLAVGLVGCTATGDESPESTGPVVQLGAPGQPNRTLSPEEAAGIEAPSHLDVDVEFVRNMVLHHAQALVMTELVDARTDDRDIRLLAERMHLSQEGEIDLMTRWLQDRVLPLRGDHDDHGGDGHGDDGHSMPGMLTDEQLEQLEGASGEEFERLFLEYMIQHHLGAVQMVDELYAAGGAQEPGIDQFARHVESDQNIEIGRMTEMLAERAS